jgi:tRNA1Val (adenine37-N6)-methyltransferase
MGNTYFRFKQFVVNQDACAMKVCTDSCLFGAFVANQTKSSDYVLDIGSGTGLLSLLLAQKFPNVPIDSVELDKQAHQQLSANLMANSIAQNCKAVHANIIDWANQEFNAIKYDLIICNPPFFEKSLLSAHDALNKAKHQLYLDFEQLARAIVTTLKPDGSAWLLVPHSHYLQALKAHEQYLLYPKQIIQVKPLPHKAYFRTIIELGKSKQESISEKEIIIKNQEGNYTKIFNDLLKDYYLNL